MLNKETATETIDGFNAHIDIASKTNDFNTAIECLNGADVFIKILSDIVLKMKQERHDVTQDIYNRFKNKEYVKSIKFFEE